MCGPWRPARAIRNGVAIAELDGDIPVDIAYGGSCTGGKRADFDAYHEVLKWGLDQG